MLDPFIFYYSLRGEERRQAERSMYEYLPSGNFMELAGYQEAGTGNYIFGNQAHPSYRITVLSRTNMVILYKGEAFVIGRVIQNQESWMSFLKQYKFPV